MLLSFQIIYFEDSGGCWSMVGRRGGRQTIPSSLCFLIVNFGKQILPHIKIFVLKYVDILIRKSVKDG